MMKATSLFGIVRSVRRLCRPDRVLNPVPRTGKPVSLTICLGATLLIGLSLPAKSASLYEEMVGDDRLALFANAVERAGRAQMLKEDGPFILFVPSDQAMIDEGSAFLLEGVMLTRSNADLLTDLVQHHMVPTRQPSAEILHRIELPTLATVPLLVDPHGTTLIVAGRALVTDRLAADNGSIFIVDRLLWPRQWQPSAESPLDAAAVAIMIDRDGV